MTPALTSPGSQLYEEQKMLADYLAFHYAPASRYMPWSSQLEPFLNFPHRTAQLAEQFCPSPERTLDLGCSVGRATFELSNFSQHVTGIDFSHAFIHAAQQIQQLGKLSYNESLSPHSSSEEIAHMPAGANPERITFSQGDALDLPTNIGKFDLIHASNLLCRLPKPAEFLQSLSQLTNTNGTVLLATPFSWLENYTPRENWPSYDSWQWLQDQLKPNFQLVHQADEPFMIRQHQRKYQWVVSKISIWQKR
ncbi:putative 4-mercaptohistidine N1-methyltransferase [Persicirhabdus sediminis]|uniref:Putative 4-mercaptohistidine N1-methyltransferase n=1 Tax=Persicirhabdus sediminis TaxID=454144 RepID=A0A8J7MGM9_9BACT|nr:putative 4-mercaptohistidine N1-methyltransferase [Persicirhabdus sediminis]MBK1792702.1 putative 4-mercaptohistidine N1-methyltransferase [Persicirhabdus sediminis]